MACRGLVIAVLIAIPVYAGAAWLLYLAWNAMSAHHIGYWIALIAVFILGIASGAFIAWLETRKASKS